MSHWFIIQHEASDFFDGEGKLTVQAGQDEITGKKRKFVQDRVKVSISFHSSFVLPRVLESVDLCDTA